MGLSQTSCLFLVLSSRIIISSSHVTFSTPQHSLACNRIFTVIVINANDHAIHEWPHTDRKGERLNGLFIQQSHPSTLLLLMLSYFPGKRQQTVDLLPIDRFLGVRLSRDCHSIDMRKAFCFPWSL